MSGESQASLAFLVSFSCSHRELLSFIYSRGFIYGVQGGPSLCEGLLILAEPPGAWPHKSHTSRAVVSSPTE